MILEQTVLRAGHTVRKKTMLRHAVDQSDGAITDKSHASARHVLGILNSHMVETVLIYFSILESHMVKNVPEIFLYSEQSHV